MEKKTGFSVFIQNRTWLKNGNHEGKKLFLPVTAGELGEAMGELGITEANPHDFLLAGYETPEGRDADIPWEWVRKADMDWLNFLAARLGEMDSNRLEKMNAFLASPFRPDSLEQLVDYTYNEECFVHVPGIHDTAELGEYYLIDSGMVQMPEAWRGGIDKEDFGSNAANVENGKFTDYGYIRESGVEWMQHYAGKAVPEQYRIMPRTGERQEAFIPASEKVKEITDRLEHGLQDFFQSSKYRDYLKVMARFHNYSLNNTVLIAMQNPHATLVAGYTTWKQQGRQVMKGQKSIKVIAPAPYKVKRETVLLDEKTGKPVMRDGKEVKKEVEVTVPAYRIASVFDVSQTEGRELPDIVEVLSGDVGQYRDMFRAVELTSPVPVGFEKIGGKIHGYYHQTEKRIAIDEGMGQMQNLKTLIHEIAHARLHDRKDGKIPDRHTREVQAESIAYCVCQYFGLDTSDYSFGYVAGWSSGKTLPELKASLETIRKASAELIGEIRANYAEIQKTYVQERVPTITCNMSEHDSLEAGKTYSVAEFDGLMRKADAECRGGNEGRYYKVRFTVNLPDGEKLTERQDIGDGYGGVAGFLKSFSSDRYHAAAAILEDAINGGKTGIMEPVRQAGNNRNAGPVSIKGKLAANRETIKQREVRKAPETAEKRVREESVK